MTALRRIPLPLHSALEMLLGIGVGALPFALGLSAGPAIVGVVSGVLIVGLALQALDTGNGPALPIAAHLAGDQGLALGLAIAAVVMVLTDHAVAAAVFAGAALVQLLLILATRYTAR
ncbi:MAG TPA: hypothetical protein VGR12_00440 [Solirubrobacteraceae bacterium]|nr:hypothetical protein [Solirubrobacteraceae bacterium]